MIIDQLPLLATAQTTDEMPIERGVTTYKVAVEDILAVASSDTTSPMDGIASIGSSAKFARQDHRHPLYDQFVRPNLLDNWYFVGGGSQQGGGQFPINQRGQTSYSGAVYGIDRWRSWDGGTSVTVNGNYLTLATGANSDGIFQYFQNIGQFHNKTITVSALVNGSLYTATGTTTSTAWIAANIDGDGSFIAFILTATEAQTTIRLAANKTATVTAAKLELGSTQTLAHQQNGVWVLNEIPDYTEQLFRCQTAGADSGDAYANQGTGATVAFTVTLSSSSWSSNTQTISNALFLATGYFYIVSPASASFADYGSAQIYADDVTTDGSMTFHCGSAPSSNLTVNIARTVAS